MVEYADALGYHSSSQCEEMKNEQNGQQMTRSPRHLHNSTSFNEQLAGRRGDVVAALTSSSSSVWPPLCNTMYPHHHHAMNHHAFQGAGRAPVLSSVLSSPLLASSVCPLDTQHDDKGLRDAAGSDQRTDSSAPQRSSGSGVAINSCTRQSRGSKVLASAISPSDSGPSNASLDNNDSNGTVFSGSPEHKGSIASRSDVNYPVIGDHSSIYLSKQNRKLVRFVTVIAYIFFVSLAAIVLSFFYYFLWDPSMEGGVASDLPHDHNSASVSLLGTVMERTGRKKFGASHFPAAISPPMAMHPDSRPLPCPCDVKGNRLSGLSGLSDPTSDDSGDGGLVLSPPPPPPPPPATPTIGHLQQAMHVGVGSKSLSNILPTAPSLYEMIARRPRVIPIHTSFEHDLMSTRPQQGHFESQAQPITEPLGGSDTHGDSATTASDITSQRVK